VTAPKVPAPGAAAKRVVGTADAATTVLDEADDALRSVSLLPPPRPHLLQINLQRRRFTATQSDRRKSLEISVELPVFSLS